MKRIVWLVAAGVVAMGSVIAVPAAAQDGPCSTADGVTVIVDATSLGGSISQRCAVDAPSSGLAALQRAGFSWSPVASQPAMVCRINGRPTPSDQTCSSTPPSNAYWGYFRATRGGTWKYSSVGAASAPIRGGVEGWVFLTGGQRPPGISPPAALAQVEVPPSTPSAHTKPSKAVPSVAATAKATGSPSTSPGAPRAVPSSASALPSQAPSTAADGVSPSDPTSAVNAAATTADVAESADSGGGSALSTFLGIAIAGGLAAAAVVMGVRRRRSS